MKKLWFAALMCAFAAVPAVAEQAVAEKGKMLLASNGARLGTVYRVSTDGSPQVIVDGKLVTIPASTLSAADGKLTTSLSKNEVLALH
jgi:hypothetical protein